jgi:SAM-dependent methyltransferase
MASYWDGRYRSEGKIWGDTPSNTATYALKAFRAHGVKSVFIPGIGYGRNARVFLAGGMSVKGVDISGEALQILKKDLPEIRYQEGGALETPFGGPYDAIYCFNVFHFFMSGDRQAFLKKCRDALGEGGMAVFTTLSEKESSYGRGMEIEPGTFESKPGRFVHYYGDDEIRKEFKDFNILESGLMEDEENHGEEGPHVHILRYILVQKPGK